MSADQQKPLIWRKRLLGIALSFMPLALLIASIVVELARNQESRFEAVGWMIAAAVVAGFNFFASFIRPKLFLLWRGSMDRYRHVSVLPFVGTALVIIGALASFSDIGSALVGLTAFAVDTGGSAWFLVATWRDRGLWG
jgi:hypothetical protein